MGETESLEGGYEHRQAKCISYITEKTEVSCCKDEGNLTLVKSLITLKFLWGVHVPIIHTQQPFPGL